MVITRIHGARLAALFAVALWCGGPVAFAQSPAPTLEVLVLGSGGPGATGRASSCYLLVLNGVARILVDAGPGSFVRLGEAKASLADTDIVLLTHLHIDHAGELPGLFKARALAAAGPIVFNVWGPDGSPLDTTGAYFPATKQFLRLMFGPKDDFAYLSDFSAPMTIRAHDIAAALKVNAQPQVVFKQGKLSITSIPGHHGDAPAVIYRIDYAGKSVTFSGDIDASGLPDLATLAKGSDLLVFNSVVLDPPGSPEVLYSLHTPPHAIGVVAEQAGVHQLLLSHLSPATDTMNAAVLASIRQSYAGAVRFAQDGMRITP
jgi:ribonuclease BN (tRNA processing enzyme)